MNTAREAPVTIRRADFVALSWTIIGLFNLSLGFVSGLGGGSVEWLYVTLGLVWVTLAAGVHRRPERMIRGTDPTPRTWFELAGLLAGLAVLSLLVFLVI
jgi:hypothetical protein